MSDIYDRKEQATKDFVEAFRPIEGQIGAMFAIDNAITGLDLFDSSDTLRKVLPKLVRSYALDALETANPVEDCADRDEAKAFLQTLANSKFESFPAVGLGHDLRIESRELAGGGLVVDDLMVHLWAFPLATEQSSKQNSPASRLARSSARRRAH